MAKWNKRVVSTTIDRMRVTRVAGVVGKTIAQVDLSLKARKGKLDISSSLNPQFLYSI